MSGIPVVIAENGLGIPVRPVEKNAPSMQISDNGLGTPIVISDLGTPFIVNGLAPPPDPNPLAPFYGTGPGMIAIHFDTDHVEGPQNAITKMINRGGGGAFFDATVNGAPLVASNGTVALSSSTGTPQIENRADIVGVRMMWVCTVDNLVSLTKFFGSDGYEVRVATRQADLSNFVQLWSDVTGEGLMSSLGPRARFPASGLMLMELDTTVAETRFFLNGVLQSTSTAPLPWANFYVQLIGQGNTASVPFNGQMGDILGVTLGAGGAAAILAARTYLADKYGITLP